MKKFVCICLAAVMMLSMVACAQTAEPAAEPAAEATPVEGEKFLVGMTNNGQADSFAIKNKAYFEENLKAAGYDVMATVDDDVAARTASIETMIAQGCDAIIVIEGSVIDLEAVLREAHDAGIKVISFTAGYDAEYVDCYVSGDETRQAEQATEQMIKYMGEKGSIVEIINDSGEMIRLRKEAMHNFLETNYPEVTVDYSMVYVWPDYFPDIYAKVEALLQAHPTPGEITGIFATFDGVGLAAASAVRDAGLQDYITIVGICGDDASWTEMQIEDSPFKATIAQSVPDMCDKAIECTQKLLNGETLDEPCPIVEAVVVDQSNFREWAGIE